MNGKFIEVGQFLGIERPDNNIGSQIRTFGHPNVLLGLNPICRVTGCLNGVN